MEMGSDIWDSILSGYSTPKRAPKYIAKEKLRENNTMEIDSIISGLSNSVKFIGQCTPTKVIQDKLQNIYIIEEVIETNKELYVKERGTSEFKGKLPFCLSCDKIVHFFPSARMHKMMIVTMITTRNVSSWTKLLCVMDQTTQLGPQN